MKQQEDIDYKRIADAIEYIKVNFKEQPSLNEVAESIHLSSFHFQRLFTNWAGVSPKKFMQFLSVNYAKELLKKEPISLLGAAFEVGLSGTGRLHDLFVNIEGMTPGEFKNGGEKLIINYSFAQSPFGQIIIASTSKGICHMAFVENRETAYTDLIGLFPKARYNQMVDVFQQDALFIFKYDWKKINQIRLHLKGTPFQLKVWESLLNIPLGKLTSYGSVANQIGKPNASRAVGTAIGNNPIAFLIPCHRVIQSSGNIGGYRWGNSRKSAIIGWEAAKINS
jgi:AraC family transcriptional regulator of adaptative response/methylated-DNA-[protein]-cysteine methyltransferase